jgi:tryptophan 2,3-dioxygenase
MKKEVNYSDYLKLENILHAQEPESNKAGTPAHDEMLFIVIHQAYELWFKQVLHEVDSVIQIMAGPSINDNSPELQTVVHRLSRTVTILKVLVHQIDIMETMTAMDFLDFRDMLRPASGFQSWQFKVLEARLGLKYENRYGQEYYISQLKEEQIKLIHDAESSPSLTQLVNEWLERMPFFEEKENWKQFRSAANSELYFPQEEIFWNEYRSIYLQGLAPAESVNGQYFDQVFGNASTEPRGLSARASRAALFIMLYRGYPILQLPFQLLNSLLEIDEQLSTWRYRHMNMVHRMIGTRIGTGGSTGREYLRGALDKHYIFSDLAKLTSFLIERRRLPELTSAMKTRLGFVQS